MQSQPNISICKYSEDPDAYRELIWDFAAKSIEEGNDSLKKYSARSYDPDDKNIETWMCFIGDKLISISAAEASHYTNDPDIAVRICRYHILKEYRFTHCGLRMGEHQLKWARQRGFEILYITHDITKRAINALYQRKKKMTVKSFNEWTDSEWYTSLQLETDFLFKTGPIVQYVYSIRLNDPDFIWKPKSDLIISSDEIK
jgi:hypothetical protein